MAAVRILGRPGLRADLLAHVLISEGVEVLIGPGEAGAKTTVAVLVEPEPEHWRAAKDAGHGVVFVATSTSDHSEAVAAMLRGADAVIEADNDVGRIVEAVEVVANGGAMVSPSLIRPLLDAARAQEAAGGTIRLTPRETDILRSIDQGHSVKQTARSLGISIKTVENLQSRMFRKLEARNRAQAISRAHAMGLLDGPPQPMGGFVPRAGEPEARTV
ncbi:MAG TPA: response regulator transcription factor [Acidimicrobiales bacterium]|nr:response regulator transcription factor [Acidimicrobiales bacterium]